MTDVPLEVVRRGEEAAYFKEVESFTGKRHRAARRSNWIYGTAAGVELGVIVLLSCALAASVPNIRLLPVFYPLQGDGTSDPPKAINSVAADMSEQSVRSAAIQLVNNCEGYFYPDAQTRYDLCSHTLVGHAKEVYQQRWFLAPKKPNPESNPQVLYPHGQIDIEKISVEVEGHVAKERFRRIVELDTDTPVNRKTCQPPVCTTWTAVIDFQPAEKMTQEIRDQVPSGLVAARYQILEGKL